MIDSHAHIISEFYDDIESLVNKCKHDKIIAVINCADSLETAKEVLGYSKIYNNFLFATAGIHPQNVEQYSIDVIREIEDMVLNNKFVAVGEIGLDYSKDDIDKEKQKMFFIKQIEVAEKYNLPVIVHSREATQDTYDILKNHKCNGVIHCYSGSVEMAKEFIKIGYYIGIGGVVTFKNSKLYEVVEQINIENILLETDSPFLSPEPFRGHENMPSNVKYVAKKISEIKNIPIDEVKNITTKNATNIFDLGMEI